MARSTATWLQDFVIARLQPRARAAHVNGANAHDLSPHPVKVMDVIVASDISYTLRFDAFAFASAAVFASAAKRPAASSV